MAMPMRQSLRLASYLMKQKLRRREKFPLLVELEPLFACNLKCAGCGKIAQPASLLKQRMPVAQAVAAVEESGAPMVSIAGGEPLMHPEIDEIVRQLLARRKIVFLCTNALLLPKHLHKFRPHRNFAWMVHIDGLRERHDASVRKPGGFDAAVAAIKQAKAAGFRVMTNTTFFNTDTPEGGARLPQRRTQSRQYADLAGVRLHQGTRSGALARRRRDPVAVRQGLRRWPAPALAAQSFAGIPRLPRGQAGTVLHRVGHPVILAAGLATAVLPAR
jgi:uncharacterized Fe-S cluster-containing radical SAM superfamily protein